MTFEECALQSGLVSASDLDTAKMTVGWSGADRDRPTGKVTDRQLAERLVEMEVINAWQAKQLLAGHVKFNLERYNIVDSIGQGGMGQVFKGVDSRNGKVVAIKVLPREKSTEQAIANFTREIRAQARLSHPNLVAAFDAGHDGNVYFLVTEYVPGIDLRKLVRRFGQLNMTASANIIFQVAAGLEHAHAEGIIHRDVKPGNVLVTPEGLTKLSDLGLAGPMEKDKEFDPRRGKIVGTADYLCPDQVLDPSHPTSAWDIYALGCTLYYAVTSKVPFPGGTPAEKARAHCELRPLDPRRLNPNLSFEFVELIGTMMAKDPAARITSAVEVMQQLHPWMPGESKADASSGIVGELARKNNPNASIFAPPVTQSTLFNAKTNAQQEHALSGSQSSDTIPIPDLPFSSRPEESIHVGAEHIEELIEDEYSTVEIDLPLSDYWTRFFMKLGWTVMILLIVGLTCLIVLANLL